MINTSMDEICLIVLQFIIESISRASVTSVLYLPG